jgi:hypothetical protein
MRSCFLPRSLVRAVAPTPRSGATPCGQIGALWVGNCAEEIRATTYAITVRALSDPLSPAHPRALGTHTRPSGPLPRRTRARQGASERCVTEVNRERPVSRIQPLARRRRRRMLAPCVAASVSPPRTGTRLDEPPGLGNHLNQPASPRPRTGSSNPSSSSGDSANPRSRCAWSASCALETSRRLRLVPILVSFRAGWSATLCHLGHRRRAHEAARVIGHRSRSPVGEHNPPNSDLQEETRHQ